MRWEQNSFWNGRLFMRKYSVLLILFSLLVCNAWTEETKKVSGFFQYSGYSRPDYADHETHSVYVTMSDGTQIAVDYFIPTGGPQKEAYPVIFQYTPYQRATINPETGRVSDLGTSPTGKTFLSYGYAMVFADMRGTGASSGWLMDFMPELATDGKEVVDWIAAQPWCDGNVGMSGGSYLGWSQTATASQKPKALKCIMPSVIPLEGFTGEVYPGGIYLQGFLNLWSGFMFYIQRSYSDASQGFRPTKPVVDEDGDGEYLDEIPVDTNGNGTFLDDLPVTYSDGEAREDIFYKAIKEHEKNIDYASWAGEAFFLDAKTPVGIRLSDISPSAHLAGIRESGIPVYNVGGWFDSFARGSFELYATLAPTNATKLAMLPGYHSVTGGPFWKFLGEDAAKARTGLLAEHLRFFDRYLKGIDNGIDTEPPIAIYVMNGDGWRHENEWPLKRQQLSTLFLGPNHGLQDITSELGKDAYTVDFTHSSTYGENGGNRWLAIGGQTPSSLPDRTEKDKQCLVYNSKAMSTDVEVTGHPVVHLWVSSTAAHGDFFVYLEDVDESGRAVLVTEGQLRSGFAGLQNNDDIIRNAKPPIDVLPDLPWHGYRRFDYVDNLLADGKFLKVVIDLLPTSWVFQKGHKMRLAIACADYPTFRLHPKLSPRNVPGDGENIVPTIYIHRGELYPSRIDLPVIRKD